jgi:hypothetical protein
MEGENGSCESVDGGEVIELEEIHGDDAQIVYIIDEGTNQVENSVSALRVIVYFLIV